MQRLVGRTVNDFQADRSEWVPTAWAKVFLVQGAKLLAAKRGIPLDHDVKHRMRGILRIALLAAEQRAVDPLARFGGKALCAVGRERRISYNRKGRRADGTTYFMREEDRLLLGRDFCGDIVCTNTWFLIRDGLAYWVEGKLAAGWTMTRAAWSHAASCWAPG